LRNGKEPFEDWVQKLDVSDRAVIDAYIDRFAAGGSVRNIKALKEGVFEIKIKRGPGYRVYFGLEKKNLVLLIAGGDKTTQFKDIEKAKRLWRQYAQER
jgi:putative addiction module killer protein